MHQVSLLLMGLVVTFEAVLSVPSSPAIQSAKFNTINVTLWYIMLHQKSNFIAQILYALKLALKETGNIYLPLTRMVPEAAYKFFTCSAP